MNTKQRLYLILGVGVAGAAAIGAAVSWSPAVAQTAATPQQSAGATVRVERTLVVPTVEIVERPARVRRARAKAQRETASQPVATSRARRVLFGSGRYRPEPFPRLAQQNPSAR
jgi:hypothetical protein